MKYSASESIKDNANLPFNLFKSASETSIISNELVSKLNTATLWSGNAANSLTLIAIVPATVFSSSSVRYCFPIKGNTFLTNCS